MTRLITDHLGTSVASVLPNGSGVDWVGGFTPWGEDWQRGTSQDSLAKRIFLRLPGQWKDPSWSTAAYPFELYYNLHRWYDPATGRYISPDPIRSIRRFRGVAGAPGPRETFTPYYLYAAGNPETYIDPLGLIEVVGCSPGRAAEVKTAYNVTCGTIRRDYESFKKCYCDGRAPLLAEIPKRLSSLCAADNITFVCKASHVWGVECRGECGFSTPFGSTINLCPEAFDKKKKCGALPCTIVHEMTHLTGSASKNDRRPVDSEVCLFPIRKCFPGGVGPREH